MVNIFLTRRPKKGISQPKTFLKLPPKGASEILRLKLYQGYASDTSQRIFVASRMYFSSRSGSHVSSGPQGESNCEASSRQPSPSLAHSQAFIWLVHHPQLAAKPAQLQSPSPVYHFYWASPPVQ